MAPLRQNELAACDWLAEAVLENRPRLLDREDSGLLSQELAAVLRLALERWLRRFEQSQ